MLPPKGPLRPSPTTRHLAELLLPASPCPILPAQTSPGGETQEAAPLRVKVQTVTLIRAQIPALLLTSCVT